MKACVAILPYVAGCAGAQLINEFAPNPDGIDPAVVDFEIKGAAGTSFAGWILTIESDIVGSAGEVDSATRVSGVFDENDILSFTIPDFENPSFTVVLSSDFTGAIGDDVDLNNDGEVDDRSVFGVVFDAIEVLGNTIGLSYASDLGGMNFGFTGAEPERLFRDRVTNEWYAVNDISDINSVFNVNGGRVDGTLFDSDPTLFNFGEVNQSLIPAPGAASVLGFICLAVTRRRR